MDIPRYLQHIGFTGTPQADLQTLQQLHRCHMLAAVSLAHIKPKLQAAYSLV